jgi:hypothetical protein
MRNVLFRGEKKEKEKERSAFFGEECAPKMQSCHIYFRHRDNRAVHMQAEMEREGKQRQRERERERERERVEIAFRSFLRL